MKKLICLILCTVIASTCVFADAPLVYELTETDEYAPDRIMVTVREEYSGWNKLFSAEDFPEINVVEIGYLTPLFTDEDEVPMLDTRHYKQVLLLIIDPEEITVPEAMEKLSQNEMILEIFPDLVQYPDDEPIDSCLPGDVNCDWELGAKDVALLLKYLSGWNVEIRPLGNELGDLNGNGQLDSEDLAIIMKKIAGYTA